MRLSSFDADDSLAQTEFSQDTFPPYAILSHTRGMGEVSSIKLMEESNLVRAETAAAKSLRMVYTVSLASLESPCPLNTAKGSQVQ